MAWLDRLYRSFMLLFMLVELSMLGYIAYINWHMAIQENAPNYVCGPISPTEVIVCVSVSNAAVEKLLAPSHGDGSKVE